jgi:putative aldouronate transport system permease protein
MVTSGLSKRNAIRKSTAERVFDALNIAFMLLMALSIIYPFWNLAVESFTDGYTTTNALRFWPAKTTLFNYEHVLTNPYIWSGYRETLIRTVFGTALNMTATILGAYALSKPYMPGRKFWMLMVVIPLFFSGGIIPSYLWNVQLGLRNTRWSLILPGLVNSYNMIVMRNFFQGVPKDLEESARIDGATNLRILMSIYIPVSTAVLATVALWVMVSHWNAWFDATIYINKAELYPLQVVLRRILLEGTQQLMDITPAASETSQTAPPNNIKAACVFVCMLPIMSVYPFLQKYFVKGTLVGAIKG